MFNSRGILLVRRPRAPMMVEFHAAYENQIQPKELPQELSDCRDCCPLYHES
jgi:hypothetical protein